MNYKKCFRGYDVPEKIQRIVKMICFRFAINGLADPMYIANTIALHSGSGDGNGNFTDDSIKEAMWISERLQGSYGRNISRTKIKELEYIIKTGSLDKEESLNGMQQFISRLKREIIITDDEWRKGFLTEQIKLVQRNMETLATAGVEFICGTKKKGV